MKKVLVLVLAVSCFAGYKLNPKTNQYEYVYETNDYSTSSSSLKLANDGLQANTYNREAKEAEEARERRLKQMQEEIEELKKKQEDEQ